MMIDRMPRKGYGYGVIRMSRRFTEHIAPLVQLRSTDIQGELQDRGAFDQIKQGLRLPDDYTILGIYVQPYQYIWCVLLEAPGIPIPDEGMELPVVTPIYRRDRDEQTGQYSEPILDRIDIAPDRYHVLRMD